MSLHKKDDKIILTNNRPICLSTNLFQLKTNEKVAHKQAFYIIHFTDTNMDLYLNTP